MDLFLLLGSNLGDREENISRALSFLDAAFGPRKRVSGLMRTEAIGFRGPEFLNLAVLYESTLSPEAILDECKSIERRMGRDETPERDASGARIYHDRIIDIDILEYGQLDLRTEKLTLPHPQINTRPFVALLLNEISSPCK